MSQRQATSADEETLALYRQAQDTFDAVLDRVRPGQWDVPSACPPWTVRDVTGHVVWGQELVFHLAVGLPHDSRTGAPGSANPGAAVDSQPVERWRHARSTAGQRLTADTLDRPGPPRLGGRLGDFISALIVDTLAHAWDIAHPLGIDPDLPAGAITRTLPFTRTVIRAPGMFGPALTPSADADEQTRWLAALGRHE